MRRIVHFQTKTWCKDVLLVLKNKILKQFILIKKQIFFKHSIFWHLLGDKNHLSSTSCGHQNWDAQVNLFCISLFLVENLKPADKPNLP